MPAQRASFTFEPGLLNRFNALFPAGERSSIVQQWMARAVREREAELAALAAEFESHPDFAQARAVSDGFDCAAADGLDGDE